MTFTSSIILLFAFTLSSHIGLPNDWRNAFISSLSLVSSEQSGSGNSTCMSFALSSSSIEYFPSGIRFGSSIGHRTAFAPVLSAMMGTRSPALGSIPSTSKRSHAGSGMSFGMSFSGSSSDTDATFRS